MKLYQLTYLISPELNSEEAEGFSQEIDSLISKKGKLIKPAISSKRVLAYPIKKQTTAYLTRSEFHLDPQETESLKKEIKTKSKILRFLLSEKKVHKIKPEKPRIKVPPKEKKEPTPKKAELEKIGEKLEEILKE
jgi:ribosomal protein S6